MKRLIIWLLAFVLVFLPVFPVSAGSDYDNVIKQTLNSYFGLKFKSLSTLSFDKKIKEFLDPEILKSEEVLNEGDLLDAVIKLRKSQINDLRFDKFQFKLEFKSIKVEEDSATVILSETFSLYYKCAPTVKNSGVNEHLILVRRYGSKWFINSDTYNDSDGIKKKANNYFLEAGVSKIEAINKALEEALNRSDSRIKTLETILSGLEDKNIFVFYLGKNACYFNGKAGKIDIGKNITPLKVSGRVVLPLEYIGKSLGYSVKFDGKVKKAEINRDTQKITVDLIKKQIVNNGKVIAKDSGFSLQSGSIMLQADILAKLFNKKLYIDDKGLIILSNKAFDTVKQHKLINRLKDYFSVLYTKENFPRIDGSTATYPFSIEAGKTLLGLDDTGAKGFITHNTTHNAYVNLINGKADIIFVTEPSKEELMLAKKGGVELLVTPFCNEGFVFLVNKENKVNNLTDKQIIDIYQGKIKNWSELGGDNKEIIPYQREANSGSQTLMENLVMKKLPLMKPPKETLVYGMGELIDRVADYSNARNALGYSVYYYATTMYSSRNVKLLSINGIKPDKNTISTGKYPFTTGYYAVIKKSEPKDSNARRLLSWILGPEGQGIVDKSGFVPLKK